MLENLRMRTAMVGNLLIMREYSHTGYSTNSAEGIPLTVR